MVRHTHRPLTRRTQLPSAADIDTEAELEDIEISRETELIIYEIGDHVGLHDYKVADDLRTVLFIVDSKGGTGRELIMVRWVVYEGHLYLSPEKAPDPKTGIFRPWILQAKLIERR